MSYKPTACHPMYSVCVFLNAVGAHLNGRNFSSPGLTKALLPDNIRVVYKSAADDKTREDALPIVAYRVTGIKLIPYYAAHGFSEDFRETSTAAEASCGVSFTVSTTSEALTSELALELGTFAFSLHKAMQEHGMYIQSVDISATGRNQANYFEATCNISASLGKHVWNSEYPRSILREIKMDVSFT